MNLYNDLIRQFAFDAAEVREKCILQMLKNSIPIHSIRYSEKIVTEGNIIRYEYIPMSPIRELLNAKDNH